MARAAGNYSIAELVAFLAALREAGIAFLLPGEFAPRGRSHFAAPEPEPRFGLVKLDIHRDIERPLAVARALTGAGIGALFLMMHRHPFNAAYFDAASTWDILSAVRGLGHEVGLHLDPFHLIRTHGDLITGLEVAAADFRARGFELRAATLHGDTSAHIRATGLNARDFFAEEQSRTQWNGKAPEGEEVLADHVGRYRYADIAARFGLAHFAEAAYRHNGALLSPEPLVYVTDNNRSLQVRNIPDGGGKTRILDTGEQFRIPPEFAPGAAAVLKRHPFLALFHPQWFA